MKYAYEGQHPTQATTMVTPLSAEKNHGHIFRPEIKLAWPEQNMTCFVGELTFHNHLLLGQFKFEFKPLRSTKPIHVC
jgi:hypothetical protein